MTSTPLARGARPFRVRAEDGEDLTIAAAHLQDAVATVGDVAFLPDERRFAMVFSRFRWETGYHRPGAHRRRRQRGQRRAPPGYFPGPTGSAPESLDD